jgi:hypothetical protein
MKDLIALYKEHNLILEINEEKITACCNRIAPRARLGYKNVFNYRYSSVERLYEHVNQYIVDRIETLEKEKKMKEERKQRAAEIAANVKVGDIFVNSWGWEQTNIDFYQVVEKPSAKTVIVREIAYEQVENSMMSHGMACDVRPVPNKFVGAESRKRLDNYGGFKVDYGICRPTEADKSHYMSWYA